MKLFLRDKVPSNYNRATWLDIVSQVERQVNDISEGRVSAYHGKASAAPTTGQWVRGDWVKNSLPSLSGWFGWICVESGSPGVWYEFGLIGAIGGGGISLPIGAQNVTFSQSGIGAETTTVQAELLRQFYPEQFGAVGNWDGVTGENDTTSIQEAITALPSGSELVFRNRYKITSSLQISSKSRIRLTGKGRIDLVGGSSGAYVIQFVGTCDDVEIDHLTITGDNDNTKQQTAIGNASGQTISRLRIHDNNISGINVGVSLMGASGSCTDGKVYNNNITNIRGTVSGSGYGIHIDSATGAHVYSNTIDNAERHGVYQARGSNNKIFANTIKNHRSTVFDGAYRAAMAVSRSSEIEVFGNKFIDCYDCSLELSHVTADGFDCKNVKVWGNYFYNRKNSVHTILVGEQAVPGATYKTSHVTIENNEFYTDYANGGTNSEIIVQNGTELTIQGNKFRTIGVTSTARHIELGNASFISSDSHCQNTLIKGNRHIFEGGTLTDTRVLTVDADICGNTSVHRITGNEYLNATDRVFYGASLTNTNISYDGPLLVGSATFDPANLVDGAGETTTVTVTGAALGDVVQGVSFSLDLQGITVTAWVSSANTVSVRFQNETTGTIDLGSGTLRVWVAERTGAA